MSDDAPKKKEDAGSPAWVMTFADLMSLLMCFFVLLLSFSEMDVNKYKQIAGSMQQAFGVQRKVKVSEPPRGINLIAREFSPGRPEPTPLNVVQQKTSENLKSYLDMEKGKGKKESLVNLRKTDEIVMRKDLMEPASGEDMKKKGMEGAGKGKDGKDNRDAGQKQDSEKGKKHGETQGKDSGPKVSREALLAEAKIKKLKADAQKLQMALAQEMESGQIEMEMTDNRILLRINDQVSFAPGSATVKQQFEPVLHKIGKILREVSGKVVVAGHTDDAYVSNYLYRTNWDLSAMRASSVMQHLFVTSGLPTERFHLEAHAGTQPLVPNDGDENRKKNRRVELIIIQENDAEAEQALMPPPHPAEVKVPEPVDQTRAQEGAAPVFAEDAGLDVKDLMKQSYQSEELADGVEIRDASQPLQIIQPIQIPPPEPGTQQ